MNFEKMYKDLGIVVKPLPTQYNPDRYAKELMSQFPHQRGVSYATSTTNLMKSNMEFSKNGKW